MKAITQIKVLFLLLTFISLLYSPLARGQNAVKNGSFEDESAWTVYNGGSVDDVVFTYPYTDELPILGKGEACLNIFGEVVGGAEWVNGLIWQQMELIGGTTYVLDAAWYGLDGDFDQGSWFQIYVSEEEPIDGQDWTPVGSTHSDRMFSFNSWSGCSGLYLDANFMDYACEDNHTALYLAPGEVGQPANVFIGLKAGAGWGGTLFEVLIDDITFRPNLIVNGAFETDSGWTVYGVSAANKLDVVISDSMANNPNLGHNNCLYLSGKANGLECNGLVWQAIELVGGETYAFNAGFRHISGNVGAGFWCHVYMSEEAPVDGEDWKPAGGTDSDLLTGFNSATACSGDAIDGTFRRDGCAGQNATVYTAPGNAGEPVTVYFGIKAGCGQDCDSFEITIDDVSLVLVSETETAVKNQTGTVPAELVLYHNFPNPFNPETQITYSIPKRGTVKLTVYDLLGKEVRTLVNQFKTPGTYTVTFNANQLSSGIYFYQLKAGDQVLTRKMLLTK